MRRSARVVAPLLASTAAVLLNGCHSPDMQRCVDAQNRVVDPKFCQATANSPIVNGYHFYYGGRGSYTPGTVVTEGSAVPESGHSYSMTNGTARGGFGSSFGGEDGGHGGGAGE